MKFSAGYLRERINACWVGKNIGGTLGTPYEGRREILDIHGFASSPGEPLPNDDLDLQLVWLRAVDEMGPGQIDSKVLGEYWISYITPSWNEYGVGKSNMRAGILPPMSGELNNDCWRHSNGAWIRTEIWACLYPGQIEKAIRMAFEDASVDHGYSEGTTAAIFVEAMECAAFLISDPWKLLEIGLSKIPEDCRVARCVRLVMEQYRQGTPWQRVRNMLVEETADLGWFQAPANVGFVVLGLLYGEGDYKKSLILAVNCGDDTDCTGATLGALLGIKDGMNAIPADWRAYIGDEIKSICMTNGHGSWPRSCTELTDCVMNLLPVTLRTPHQMIMGGKPGIEIGAENDFSDVPAESLMGGSFAAELSRRARYSFTANGIFADALVEFDAGPSLDENGQVTGRITLRPKLFPEQMLFELRYFAPEGWQVSGPRHLHADRMFPGLPAASGTFTVTSGERIEAVNHLIVEVSVAGRPTPLAVPVRILG